MTSIKFIDNGSPYFTVEEEINLTTLSTFKEIGASYDKLLKVWRVSKAYLSNCRLHGLDVEVVVDKPLVDKELIKSFILPSMKTYQYQVEGAEFLVQRSFAILGDALGTGKTFTALLAIKYLIHFNSDLKILIISPLSLIKHWQEEAQKLDITLHEFDGKTINNLAITNYEKLRKYTNLHTAQFNIVVLDESTKIRNNSQQRKGVKQLHTNRMWLISGILVEKSPLDVFNLVNTFYYYFHYPLFDKTFVIREKIYIRKLNKFIEIPQRFINLSLLAEQLQPIYLRREKKDIGLKNVIVVSSNIVAPLTSNQYKKLSEIKSSDIPEEEILSTFTAIRLILDDSNYTNNERIDSGKFDELLKILKDITTKVIIFTAYKIIVHKIYNVLSTMYEIEYVDGDTSIKERLERLERFKKSTTKILLTTDLLSMGQNIPEANVTIHYDLPLTASTYTQRIGRIDRMNVEKDEVLALNLFTQTQFDERVKEILLEKASYNNVLTKEQNTLFSVAEMKKMIDKIV